MSFYITVSHKQKKHLISWLQRVEEMSAHAVAPLSLLHFEEQAQDTLEQILCTLISCFTGYIRA